MTAARNLTDADVEAIADALARRLRRTSEPDSANEAPLSPERREAIDRQVRARMKRIRQRNGRA